MSTKAAPPPPGSAAPPSSAPSESGDRFAITSGRVGGAQRVVVYGPGGIGKSTLSGLSPNPVLIDIENGTRELDVQRINGVEDFASLRACLQSKALDGFDTIVLDSATRAQEWAVAHTLATVRHEKGHNVKSIEGYGFGKGYIHVYETFLLLMADLDRHVRCGRNVILIAHECTSNVPNPVGDDWIRYEPHLQNPKSGNGSIRNRVVQWADHVLFIGYDVNAKDGKGKGTGTRTIFPKELPSHLAKSRLIHNPLPYQSAKDGAVWQQIFGGAA